MTRYFRTSPAARLSTAYRLLLKFLRDTRGGGGGSFSPDFDEFRFYDSDAGEATSSPLANEGIDISVNVSSGNVSVQLRMRVQETGGKDGKVSDDWQLQFSVNGGTAADVTTTSTEVQGGTAGLTNDDPTTNRGTNGITDGTGSFVAGEQCTDGLLDDLQLTANNFTEIVYGLTIISASVNNGDTLDFTLSSPTGITNTATPRITIVKSAPAEVTIPSPGTLTLSGIAPTVTAKGPAIVLPGVGSLSITGLALKVAGGASVFPNSGSLTISPQTPAVKGGASVSPGTGSLTLSGVAPTVTTVGVGASVSPGLGSLTLSGIAPTITATGGGAAQVGRVSSVNIQESVSISRGVRDPDFTVGSSGTTRLTRLG